MSGISQRELIQAGIDPAHYFYASRILAGYAEMPEKPEKQLIDTINFIKEKTMTKGRKPASTAVEAVGPQFSGATPPDMAEQERTANQLSSGMEDALALGKAIGRLETAQFYETISHSVMLASFEEAKKSKAYRNLINPKSETYFASLEEFCEVRLGASIRRVQQILNNRNALGQETFDQAQRLGLRQVDYNAIKALPAPKQEIIAQAIAEGTTREEVVTALRELAAQDQREIESLTKENSELKAESEATGKLLEEKNKKLDALAKRKRHSGDPWPEEVADTKADLVTIVSVADEALGKVTAMCIGVEEAMGPLEEGSDAFNAYKTVVHALHEAIERQATLVAALRADFEARLYGHIALDKTHLLAD